MSAWIELLVGPSLAPGITLVLATIVILLAFIALYWIYRLLTGPRKTGSRRNREARLAVMDAAAIDPRRRLVLVRRDNVEHLIMIGGPNDMVIESDIGKPVAAAQRSTLFGDMASPATSQPAVSRQPPVKTTPPKSALAKPIQAKPKTEATAATMPSSTPASSPKPFTPLATPPIPTPPTRETPIAGPTIKPNESSTPAAPLKKPFESAASLASSAATLATKPAMPKAKAPEISGVSDKDLAGFEKSLSIDMESLKNPPKPDTAKKPSKSTSLSSEMDELLSEITGEKK